jgi:spore maturation protein CgeB
MCELEPNLSALAGRNRELASTIEQAQPSAGAVEVVRARSGAPTLRCQGRLEASAEDPEAEGERVAAHFIEQAERAGARRLVLFGLGVHTLRHLGRFEGAILVVEPSLAVARAVLEHVALADALARVELLVAAPLDAVLRHPLFADRERGVLLAHAGARQRAPALFAELLQRFHPGGEAHPLDVAVVPPLYGGSLPVARAAARALRELGHRVREIDLAPFAPAYAELLRASSDLRLRGPGEELRAGLTRVVGEAILTQFLLDPPDVVFGLAQAPLDLHTLARLRQRGILRAFWFCEDAHVMPYWRDVCGSYDFFFHLQPDVLGEVLRERGTCGMPLRMGFDPSVHRPVELSAAESARYACELSFVGAGYHNRIQFLPGLADLGLRLYGTEWPAVEPLRSASPELNQRQSSEASNLIFNASQINLNLHSSPWTDGVNPLGDYLNPRCFELAGAGAFQLVDERRDLGACFATGSELETYADLAECRKKIVYYRAHDDERREIATRARERALAEHTYGHRMQDAVEALRAGPTPLLPRRRARPTVGAAIESLAVEEPHAAAILARVPAEHALDAEALQHAVLRGEGELTREERLLLFLRESMSEIQLLNAAGDPQ